MFLEHSFKVHKLPTYRVVVFTTSIHFIYFGQTLLSSVSIPSEALKEPVTKLYTTLVKKELK